jgi:hypothetical protein
MCVYIPSFVSQVLILCLLTISLLQWAAINNHYALCHFLIQSGANVNAKGGDAVATPVLWAAKRCHYYVVNLLLEHGADPLLTDDQGFNLLHSATLDGNVYQLVLLLHQDIPVDIPDSQAHTALMWAAYKGYPSCVDLFLRWGANVYATDDQGFTALHWALVKGSQGSIQKLIEYGADRFAKNNDGKTPATTAEEMNTSRQWLQALSEAGYNKDGTPKEFPIPGIKDTRWFLNRLIFFWPFVIVFVCVYLLANYPIYVGAPVAAGFTFGLQWCLQKLLEWGPSNMRNIHHTPFMAGVFAGSLFWVGIRWLTTVLPCTFCPFVIRDEAKQTRDDTHELFSQYSIWNVLRPYSLFLFLHDGKRPGFCAQVEQSERIESGHR